MQSFEKHATELEMLQTENAELRERLSVLAQSAAVAVTAAYTEQCRPPQQVQQQQLETRLAGSEAVTESCRIDVLEAKLRAAQEQLAAKGFLPQGVMAATRAIFESASCGV